LELTNNDIDINKLQHIVMRGGTKSEILNNIEQMYNSHVSDIDSIIAQIKHRNGAIVSAIASATDNIAKIMRIKDGPTCMANDVLKTENDGLKTEIDDITRLSSEAHRQFKTYTGKLTRSSNELDEELAKIT
jgi:ribosomal protein L23